MADFELGARELTTSGVVADAFEPRHLTFAEGVLAAVEANAVAAADAAASSAAYGRTTGVGANRDVAADDSDDAHGLRLVRSHTTGAGTVLGASVGRATMLIRAHQLSAAGSGIPTDVLVALVDAANDGRVPPVREFGGIGTGDIVPLGELALCLLGEMPWLDGSVQRYLDHIGGNGALAFMSSSAPTLAVAALATESLRTLARASVAVAAIGLAATRANPQQWSAQAAATRPSDEVTGVIDALQFRLAGSDWVPARTQDPLSWRTIPFVAGPLWRAVEELASEVDSAIAATAENPRFHDGRVWHHGAFMLTSLGLRLDAARLALVQWASTSLARSVKLHDPLYTGVGRFLAEGPAGSSGNMVLEYTAASALETVRTLADPTSRHTVTISIGNEDHASFASRGALATAEAVRAAEVVFACELLSAVRALRSVEGVTCGDELVRLLGAVGSCGGADRQLVDDLAAAVKALSALA